ncbi:ATP-binding protein [Xylophilus sp. GOD-11R]|uniref:hybrid sensor histidine kinase/response regulator n=1 Tax=Xylophilus sp. GOD-11R TaxID=3089814 RepID=UPI00298C884A|nr:ATP-binding protein [Xylophilus sp. GOD-11R]WPB57791.1 histidine kinase [Xylophilus sp. GOD-11R]
MADEPLAPLRILHLEDSPTDHALVRMTLQRAGRPFSLRHVETLDGLLSALRTEVFDVVIVDYNLPGFTAIDAWNALGTDQRAAPPFVVLSGAIGEAAAVHAIRRGISDYLLKDDVAKLPHVIARAIEFRTAQRERERADRELALSERRLAELTEHLQQSIEQERAAIAREIHDDIGGSLAAVKFDLAWIVRHADGQEMQRHAQAGVDMLRHAMDASQRIMMNLRPPVLEQGIGAAIQWLADNFTRRTGTPVRIQAPAERIALAPTIELAAYRTAQEALTNITKHAPESTEVHIELTDGEGVLTLEIADNGSGIPPEMRDKPRAFGLRGLQERAKTAGGWLDISGRPGGGTSIILSVPLTDQADASPGDPP